MFPFTTPWSDETDADIARFRAEDPVPLVRLPDGHEVRLVTRYADVRLALSDSRFSRAASARPDAPTLMPGTQSPEAITSMDPPEHARLRRLVSRAFTFRSVERMRPRVAAMTAGLLDAMAEHGPPADFVAMLADPLPAMVICEMLGIPAAERAPLTSWLKASVDVTGLPPEQLAAAQGQAAMFLLELMAAKRREPQDDLLTALVEVHDGSDRLSEPELLMIVMSLFGAGQETTTSQLSKSVLTLFRHPDQHALLVDKPELVPNAVEELLRYTRLGRATFPRIPTADMTLSDTTVASGVSVFPVIYSANRDPAVFADPDRFDVTRADAGSHLAFGHGIHHCLGAPLARLELQEALGALLARFPTLQLAVPEAELRWDDEHVTGGLVALPVTW